MADKLRIYKGALRLLGPHELATLTDDRPERYQLDDAWDDAVEHLLTQGLWNFGIRAVEMTADDDEEPLFGWDYGFLKPDDWVRTAGISNEATFRIGFEDYEDEAGKWFANVDTLYVRYVSNDAAYGLNIGAWRQPFAKALEAYLAFESGLPISNDRGNRNDLYSLYKERLTKAKTLDAFDESVKYSPAGRVVRSRFSRRFGKDG
ncbi:hypothetical protein [Chelativorans xinjiangense]|uniref:hypothetical protein n=1 Tax=Chelativorans xinjiangense TaxID=2681485 RepID=UPI001356F812|nr:hypothetical protein [Chelativorans xinjiangense]